MGNRKLKISGTVLFRETQHFRVAWIWILIICSVLVSIGLTAATGFADKADKKGVGVALALIIPLETAMLYLFYIVKLETIVTADGVFYRWQPFFRKYSYIDRKEVEHVCAENGPALSYGFHIVPGYGRVNNMGPGMGFRFVLNNGRKIFIGTNMLNKFQTALEEIVKIQ